MQDVMFPNETPQEREQLLRDNCDKIVERSYTKRFDQTDIDNRRGELESVSIEISELEQRLAEIRADYKGRIKPLQERRAIILDELKARGEWITGEVFKFIDHEEGRVAFYTPDGFKLEERPIQPDERQINIVNAIRNSMRTGTDD